MKNGCEHKKQHSARNIGKTTVTKCNKQSTNTDENGRLLCRRHFNKWFKRKYKTSYSEFIKEELS